MLTEQDLQIIRANVGRMVEMMECYGCNNPPDIGRLKLICKNIDIYFHEPECLEELETYIKDDWKDAFRVQPRIIDCYIPCEDIDLKAKYNEEYEGCCSVVNYRIVGEWGRRRHWYKRYTLASIGKKSNDFAHMYKYVVSDIAVRKSRIQSVSDELWTFAYCLCVAEDEEKLEKWFYSDIPAFGYLSLYDMSMLENGERIMQFFLLMVPFP